MKKYTQAEFDAFPIVDGVRQCPTGDYTEIKAFGAARRFGANCRFGANRHFYSGCIFGEGCIFGADCHFYSGCIFGAICRFGERCRFGDLCYFSVGCSFGEWCSFGANCNFGANCRFGAACSFEGYEVQPGYPFLAIAGAGSEARTTYFFNHIGFIRVRSGCFFGTLERFRAKVLIDTKGNKKHIKAIQYLGMANIAAATFDPTQIEL